MSKILKNVTLSPIFVSDTGVSIPASSQYLIPPQDYLLWAASSDTVTYVGNADLRVLKIAGVKMPENLDDCTPSDLNKLLMECENGTTVRRVNDKVV